MAKGFERREYQKQRGMQYGAHPDAIVLQKIADIVTDLYMCTEERDRARMWASASRLLAQTKADKERVAKIMLEKRVGALSKLVTDLQQDMNAPKVGKAAMQAQTEAVVASQTAPNPTQDAPIPVDTTKVVPAETDSAGSDQLNKAFRAFKKRLKVMRMDDESKLGYRAMTSGRKSSILAIQPPREFPRSVWDELVKQGRLKNAGGGFYELAE